MKFLVPRSEAAIFLVGVVATGCWLGWRAGAQAPPTQVTPLGAACDALKGYDKLSGAQRNAFNGDSLQNLDDLGDILGQQMESPDDSVFSAVAYLAGQFRLTTVGLGLVLHLTRRGAAPVDADGNKIDVPWGAYPAQDAMVRIGWPSLDSLMGWIETQDDPALRAAALNTLVRVFGGDKALAQVYLQGMLKLESDKSKALHVSRALNYLSGRSAVGP